MATKNNESSYLEDWEDPEDLEFQDRLKAKAKKTAKRLMLKDKDKKQKKPDVKKTRDNRQF
jgi:hypothetical protein